MSSCFMYAPGNADRCTACAASVTLRLCQLETVTSRSQKAPVAYRGSINCATVPQPWLGRCWNSPMESRLTDTPSCGYLSDSGTALLATLCRSLSCSAVATATTAAWPGRLRCRVTSTMTAALAICTWVNPATGATGRLGAGAAGDGDGAAGGTDRAWPRDTSSCARSLRESRSAAARSGRVGAAW